jgi:hypothetical protein
VSSDDPIFYPEEHQSESTSGNYKLDAVLPIINGTNKDELEKGVSHFAGSVLPCENDNSKLAGP